MERRAVRGLRPKADEFKIERQPGGRENVPRMEIMSTEKRNSTSTL